MIWTPPQHWMVLHEFYCGVQSAVGSLAVTLAINDEVVAVRTDEDNATYEQAIPTSQILYHRCPRAMGEELGVQMLCEYEMFAKQQRDEAIKKRREERGGRSA